MEKVNTSIPAAEGKRRNFFIRAASRVNDKRRKIMLGLTTFIVMNMSTAVSAFAASNGGGGGGTISNEGDDAFFALVGFFCTWIGRIGLLVAFIGGIMFGFAIKNDEADQKQRGIMTLAAGFIVYALTRSMGLFFPGANIPLL